MNIPTCLEDTQDSPAPSQFSDGFPHTYRLKTIGSGLQLGTVATFLDHYKQNLLEVPGRIVIGQIIITTTPEITAILRALLYTGCCRIEERSDACRDIFMRACKAGPHIGPEELLSTFVDEPKNKFVGILQQAILEVLGGNQ